MVAVCLRIALSYLVSDAYVCEWRLVLLLVSRVVVQHNPIVEAVLVLGVDPPRGSVVRVAVAHQPVRQTAVEQKARVVVRVLRAAVHREGRLPQRGRTQRKANLSSKEEVQKRLRGSRV